MSIVQIGIIIFVLIAPTAYAAPERLVANLKTHYSAFTAGPPIGRLSAFERSYAQWFAPLQNQRSLERIDNAELAMLYQAAETATFYSNLNKYLRDTALDLGALEDRNNATVKYNKEMFHTLVRLRLFSQAKAFHIRHPNMPVEALPVLHDDVGEAVHGPTVLKVDPDQAILTRQPAKLDRNAQIVVVTHPLCHFAKYGMRDLNHGSQLMRVFKRHAIWLAPQDGRLYVKTFQQWNREHPDEQIVMAWKGSEWPKINKSITSWATPTFYFFKDGKLVTKVVGWPKQGNLKALTAATRKIGLLR